MTDESGKVTSTYGAFIPNGYSRSDDPEYPWICPIRSCRVMVTTIHDLGKHFCVSHPLLVPNRQDVTTDKFCRMHTAPFVSTTTWMAP